MATITTKETHSFTWEGLDRSALRVGDEISEVLKNDEEVIFVVMDEGVIGLKNCLREEHRMNNDWTNKGGWQASEMRRYLNEEVFAVLPDELQAIIKPRALGNGANTFEDKLWLFSEVEIFGEQDWTEKEPDRGTQFEYFKNPANRVKTDADGTASGWWERSPYASDSYSFCIVYNNGSASSGIASNSWGVCFGFYI